MYKPSKYGWFMTLLYQRCFGRESIWNGFVAYLSRATGKQMVAASFACVMCQEVFRATLADTNLLKWMWFDMFGKSGTSGFFGFYWSVVNSSVSWALRCVKQLESWKLKLGDPSCLTEAVSAVQLINQWFFVVFLGCHPPDITYPKRLQNINRSNTEPGFLFEDIGYMP